MAWWWDDNNDVHHYEAKSEDYRPLEGMKQVATSDQVLQMNVQKRADFKVAVSQIVTWENGPVLTWSKYGNDSQGYWSWTSTLTVPLPKSLLQTGPIDLSMTLAILTDVKQPYGNYSKPENVVVDLKGFGTVYKTRINVGNKPKHGTWWTDIYLAGKAIVDEQWPNPHVVVSFNTENVGGVQGSVKIDFDTVVYLALGAYATRVTLQSIRDG